MKRIFFSLLILLAFFGATHYFAAGLVAVGNCANVQKKATLPQDNLDRCSADFFYCDSLEIPEDDTNDNEDEDCPFISFHPENQYLDYAYFYASFSKPIHFNRYPRFHRYPVYILFGVFRV